MQLTPQKAEKKPEPKKSLKIALSAATATLLAVGSFAHAEESVPTEPPVPSNDSAQKPAVWDQPPSDFFSRTYSALKGWAKFNGEVGLLYYKETNRVSAFEPSVNLVAMFDGGKTWSNHLTLDSLTGASPNGAAPSRNAQTFTGPSGNSSYRVDAGQVPVDGSFHDTRIAYSTGWFQPLGEKYEFTVGGGVSSEYDYRSLTLSSTVSRYLNSKNTKLSLGASLELDASDPVGGAPQGFDTMNAKLPADKALGKTVQDFLIGLSQVMSRRLIVQANYSIGSSHGYMTDPYKLLSEVLPEANVNAGDSTGVYYYEKRPDARTKNSLYVGAKYHLLKLGILSGSYRYFWDSWHVHSHTFGVDYDLPLGPKWHAGLDVRYYLQSKADFYRPFLIQGEALPSYASADYRLGDMDAITVGAKVGKKLGEGKNDLTFHLQYYQQTPDSNLGAFGSLAQYTIAPSVKALVLKMIFGF